MSALSVECLDIVTDLLSAGRAWPASHELSQLRNQGGRAWADFICSFENDNDSGGQNLCRGFALYCVHRSQFSSEVCEPPVETFDPDPSSPIPDSFHPEKDGIDLRFDPCGNKFREMPRIDLDTEPEKDPSRHQEKRRKTKKKRKDKGDCTKLFDGTQGGVFFWMCGHAVCYGWTIIYRAEGRRDAFAAIVRCMRRPPKFLIYDFSCSLMVWFAFFRVFSICSLCSL